MDPRVKPEDDEVDMVPAKRQRMRLTVTPNTVVILGLDPRIHA
ncbi:hypothetical protein [Neoaquamicrobium sediminum]